MIQLRHIAEISRGFQSARNERNPSADTSVYLVTPAIVSRDDLGRTIIAKTTIEMTRRQIEVNSLQDGDVIFLNYSNNRFAHCYIRKDVVFPNDIDDGTPLVASDAFVVIRPTDPRVNPEYLAVFMNTRWSLQRLAVLARGTNICQINIDDIKRFEVPLPDEKTQGTIARVEALRLEHNRLAEKKNGLMKEMAESICYYKGREKDQTVKNFEIQPGEPDWVDTMLDVICAAIKEFNIPGGQYKKIRIYYHNPDEMKELKHMLTDDLSCLVVFEKMPDKKEGNDGDN